jgi:hypothetical protein
VSFVVITLCVISQRVIPKVSVHFLIDSVRKLLDTPSYILPRALEIPSCIDVNVRKCPIYSPHFLLNIISLL